MGNQTTKIDNKMDKLELNKHNSSKIRNDIMKRDEMDEAYYSSTNGSGSTISPPLQPTILNNIESKSNNNNDNNKRRLIKYNTINHGVTSKISLGIFEGKTCVIKCIKQSLKRSRNLFKNEIKILNKIKHNNIIKMYACFKDNEYYYIILEYAKIDLAEFRMKCHMNELHVKIVIYRLLKSVQYLHNNNICHRDLKPENVVFKKDNYFDPILIDFGECIRLNNNDNIYDNELVGTPNYMAPERLQFSKLTRDKYKKSDIWGIGVITFELITGYHLFHGNNNESIYRNILSKNWQWPNIKLLPYNPSQTCKDFVSNCLEYDTRKRFNAKLALNHEWFNNISNYIRN